MKRIVKKPTERKDDIIKAARKIFETDGYDKITMQDIMNKLDIAKGTIYHYFVSKEALLEAVIEDIVDANIEHIQDLVNKSSGTALEKIEILAKAGDISSENQNLLEVIHRPNNSSIHSRLLAVTIIKLAPLYEKLIKQGCNEGVFKTNNPLECAEFVLAGVQFLTDMGIYSWSHKDLIRRSQAFPKLIEQLLDAPKNSFNFMIKNTKIKGKINNNNN